MVIEWKWFPSPERANSRGWSVGYADLQIAAKIRQDLDGMCHEVDQDGRSINEFHTLRQAQLEIVARLDKQANPIPHTPFNQHSTLPKDIQDLLWAMVDDTSIAREGALIKLVLEARRQCWIRQALLFRFTTPATQDWAWAKKIADMQARTDVPGLPDKAQPANPPADSDCRDPFPQSYIPPIPSAPTSGLTRELFTEILKEIAPSFERESVLLTPYPQWTVDVISVLDALRKRCNPPLSESDVNQIMESFERPEDE
jgi:hypothetical protein